MLDAVLGGIGGALLMTPAFAAVGHFFERCLGLTTGLANISGCTGDIIIILILRKLLPTFGFPWPSRILDFLFLVLPSLKPANKIVLDMTALKNINFHFALQACSSWNGALSCYRHI